MVGNGFDGEAAIAVEIADKGVSALKKIEFVDAADKWLAHKIRPKEPKPGKIEIIQDQMPDITDALGRNSSKIIDEVGDKVIELIDTIWEASRKEIKKQKRKSGSKVKVGIFSGCPIIYAGPKSCILLDKEKHELLYLTPECVTSSRYCGKKRIRFKYYYYYQLVFIDGSESYIMVSGKHRHNIESCSCENSETPLLAEDSPEEYEDNDGAEREDTELSLDEQRHDSED